MIYEIMRRRFEKKDPPWPDMIMIDGGIGQLSSAKRALDELKITIPICSLAKSRTVSSFTRKEITKSEERIFIPNRKNPIILREGSPALQLLQQVRDEAHRFSLKSHRVRRRIASGVKT
jgi:excinuclease ABC subunit C